jgi:hypothetical protein
VAEITCDDLVERDGVAKTASTGMGCGGEKGDVGGVGSIDSRMGNAAEDGEIVSVLCEFFEVRGGRVVLAG